MKCPHCGSRKGSDVIDSRNNTGAIRRRRKCHSCGERWGTYEYSDEDLKALLEQCMTNALEKSLNAHRFERRNGKEDNGSKAVNGP